MAVYAGFDEPQQLIKWNEKNPAFNVSELTSKEQPVKEQFKKQYIYYLGAHTNCSCGFSPESGDGPEGTEESLASLATFLAKSSKGGTVEIFVCWEGDWSEKPTKRETLYTHDLAYHQKWFNELQFTTVKKNQPGKAL